MLTDYNIDIFIIIFSSIGTIGISVFVFKAVVFYKSLNMIITTSQKTIEEDFARIEGKVSLLSSLINGASSTKQLGIPKVQHINS